MISRANGSRNSPLIKHIRKKCHHLTPQKCDDSTYGRRINTDGKSEFTHHALELIDETIQAESLERIELVALDDRMMREAMLVYMVHKALLASGYEQLWKLNVYCVNGRIMLRGRVPTYYLKQIALSVTLSIDGIREIENNIEVVRP